MLDQAKKEAIIFLVILLIIVGAGLFGSFIYAKRLKHNLSEIKSLNQEIEQMKSKLEMNKIIDSTMVDPSAKQDEAKEGKKIFKIKGALQLSPEDNFVKQVDDVVLMIKENNIGVKSIDYAIDTESPMALDLQKTNCSMMKLTLTLSSTYEDFLGFIQSVTNYEYAVDIDSVDIVGNRKNKNDNVDIVLVLNLFAQK